MIGGFIVGRRQLGTGAVISVVLVRAIGPSLGTFGVSDALADPTLELRDENGVTIASDDNWKDSQEAEIEATQLEPSDDREPALLESVPSGAYTAIVRGKGDTTGVSLVEVYLVR